MQLMQSYFSEHLNIGLEIYWKVCKAKGFSFAFWILYIVKKAQLILQKNLTSLSLCHLVNAHVNNTECEWLWIVLCFICKAKLICSNSVIFSSWLLHVIVYMMLL